MSKFLVLTVIGEDKPGLVEALSRTIAEHDGNWLESRMAHLAGKFAGILRVQVAEAHAGKLMRALDGLASDGLRVVSELGAGESQASQPITLELVGADHPGIVRDVSMVLARRGVNVEELSTECTDAPMSGQTLFRARARLHLPASVRVEDLRGDLEGIAADVMVDLSLEPSAGTE